MKIKATHKHTGADVVLDYNTLKEAMCRTQHYLEKFEIIDVS